MLKKVTKQFLTLLVITSMLGTSSSVVGWAKKPDNNYLVAEPGAKPSKAGELQILVVYDIIFFVVAQMVFEYTIED